MPYFHCYLITFLVSCVSDTLLSSWVYILNTPLVGRKGSITVIITPLIALMLDHKQCFEHKGMAVEFVGEAQDDESAVMAMLKGEIQLVYISPGCILNIKKFQSMLQKSPYQERLVALVVDEAHCIQMWQVNEIIYINCCFIEIFLF